MDLLFKVLIIGDAKVGKTSFVNRYVHGVFQDEYKVTIGVAFALKEIYWHDHKKIKLQLWDIAGQERYNSMTRVYYKESSGCILMFDLTDRESFVSVLKWKKDLDNKCMFADGKPVPCILLANKSDLKQRAAVDSAEVETLCKENGFIGWSEVSVKENVMLQSSIDYLIECILDRQKNVEIDMSQEESTLQRQQSDSVFKLTPRSGGTKKDGCSC